MTNREIRRYNVANRQGLYNGIKLYSFILQWAL
jgi:hypothetical protein